MSEMSLQEQIRAIDDVIESFGQVERDINYLNEKVSDVLTYLRQNGLRTEITEMVNSKYMGHVNNELGNMLVQMNNCDKRYLSDVKERLMRAGNEL